MAASISGAGTYRKSRDSNSIPILFDFNQFHSTPF
jgi:hypothetical protein